MTTVKQAEWEKYKIEQRHERASGRGVTTTITEVRKHNPCTCVHTPKHHRKGGGCRPGCGCDAGIR